MLDKFYATVFKNGGSYSITIPKTFAKKVKLEAGDFLTLELIEVEQYAKTKTSTNNGRL